MSETELEAKRRKIEKVEKYDEDNCANSLNILDEDNADEPLGEEDTQKNEKTQSERYGTHSDGDNDDDGDSVCSDRNKKVQKNKHYLIEHMENKSKLLNNITSLEENKLFVKNLTEEITKNDLVLFFSNANGYVDTRIVYDSSGKSKTFAYIEFDNKENAYIFFSTLQDSNVDNYKKFMIKDVSLYVAICKSKKSIYEEKKVFIKFIKCDMGIDNVRIKQEISNFLCNHSIAPLDIRLLGENPPTHGYIELMNNEDVVSCVESIKEGILEDLQFSLDYCIPIIKKKIIPNVEKIKANKEKNKQAQEEKKKEENSSTIVVKNLHYNTRKYKLEKLFKQIGEIEKIYLSKKVSENNIKRNRGFAFITFKNANDATSALILNDSIIDGRSILVSKFCQDGERRSKNGEGDQSDGQPDNQGIEKTKKSNPNGNNHYFNNNARNNYPLEKKRINLNKSNNPNTLTEKRVDDTGEGGGPTQLTNDDFRKFFF
ncbi:RNA-binding protein [Plasmodium gonderi]|uniref:RNA-binding protein n=1 Tax=Plasmodium gonderi TaxID=77519 RepID=A0A1Y1JHP4_PLAGO|nr:RNA-binding protein [Plasmodium gonderi]GAW80272.1 RNA-binding protein [Plasmodium gonderi]